MRNTYWKGSDLCGRQLDAAGPRLRESLEILNRFYASHEVVFEALPANSNWSEADQYPNLRLVMHPESVPTWNVHNRRSIVVTDMFSRLSTLEQGMALARMNADKGELALNISRHLQLVDPTATVGLQFGSDIRGNFESLPMARRIAERVATKMHASSYSGIEFDTTTGILCVPWSSINSGLEEQLEVCVLEARQELLPEIGWQQHVLDMPLNLVRERNERIREAIEQRQKGRG